MSETSISPQGEKVTRKRQYVPDDDKDYQLSRINIDDAENGVVIKCGYRLKDAVRDKLRADGGDIYKYEGYGNDDEQHVFENKQDAKAFIAAELDTLFGE